MKLKIGLLVYVAGKSYLGCHVDKSVVAPYLSQVPLSARANQQSRDGGKYHMTIVPPKPFGYTDDMRKYVGMSLNVSVDGLGSVSDDKSTAYYLAMTSSDVQQLLSEMGLAPKDLHITLGFTKHDVHGVRKLAN